LDIPISQKGKGNIKYIKPRSKITPFEIVVYAILTIWALIIVLPFYNVIVVSFAKVSEYTRTPFMLFPKQPSLESYDALFSDGRVWIGYRTSLTLLAMGLPLSLSLITCTAYALSKDSFPGKKFFLYATIFTMYFNGGIIPLYLLVRALNLMNSLFSVTLSMGMNTFFMIIMRNYFMAQPAALQESARIDGASEWDILLRVMIPLSKPILATVALFLTVNIWNHWFLAMIFIRDTKQTVLQLVLRSIVIEVQVVDANAYTQLDRTRFVLGIKMAAVSVVMVPIMCVYPFLQKYFVKGIMVGAIKA
jgi:putative aldouronate transport system permease protein